MVPASHADARIVAASLAVCHTSAEVDGLGTAPYRGHLAECKENKEEDRWDSKLRLMDL